ncbi:TetR family transcriptional regulator [Nakamurella sp. YIM 132087]|uniref:TetR family transcriptional regulator n=1 Tax=Nakamurella alba TaxID=2665158 RepID=A0A7K1FKB8_9ACTN|nr:TetR/AcrR family transcriptional regulator [Nakamurella alba]MTD14582.1 TetR family transcriptional regulator [Nakamurella alba]
MIETAGRTDTRARIVEVAARLLQEQGPVAVTTRGVAEQAGVQAPTIYRLFGDKDGLLEAVAEHVMNAFVAAKARLVADATAADVDPLDDLRDGWRTQINFGIAHPALFRLLGDPDRVRLSPAARSGREVLAARVHRLARTGRLRVSEDRAVDLIQAAGTGVIQTLLATPPDRRDPQLADEMWEAVLDRILTPDPAAADTTRGTGRTGSPASTDAAMATSVAFRALVPDLTALSAAERALIAEWLDRIVNNTSSAPAQAGTSGPTTRRRRQH